MILRNGRSALIAVLAAGVALGGCSQLRDHQGFVIDETLVSAIQPGTDTRDSVMNTLGRPTFTGGFDQSDWYYLSRNTRNMAFNMPRPDSQTVLHVRFDAAGNVVKVERKGMEQVASITPMRDKTPTLGRRHSIWDEIFGNIGAVGSGMGAGAGQGGSGPNQ
ncbi:MAG: outer membrane protein assembly factor BamE [Alphaproteobacteria bacterium]|nr:outer membrane protein assembly factor BamE [Alphaproteobacteria bacterium]MBV9372117.1 outer membrane protein assembly factor BamE [Alphaproteobacteria bacterium]MBV9899851.1 outer membrane protein assembly factor BamE [Alphaproteobacteria bacterium]